MEGGASTEVALQCARQDGRGRKPHDPLGSCLDLIKAHGSKRNTHTTGGMRSELDRKEETSGAPRII